MFFFQFVSMYEGCVVSYHVSILITIQQSNTQQLGVRGRQTDRQAHVSVQNYKSLSSGFQ